MYVVDRNQIITWKDNNKPNLKLILDQEQLYSVNLNKCITVELLHGYGIIH